jgi:obg-like ATPase 1
MLCLPSLSSSSTLHSARILVVSVAPPHSRAFSVSSAAPAKKASSARMPPKKLAPNERAKLGRPSNNLKMGIVGLPNVGKSSLFNVIAKCDLGKSANFPYGACVSV